MELPSKGKRGTWDDNKGQHLNKTKVDEVKDAGNEENLTIRETSNVSTPNTRENVAVNEKNDFEEGAPSKNILPLSMCFSRSLLFFFMLLIDICRIPVWSVGRFCSEPKFVEPKLFTSWKKTSHKRHHKYDVT